MILAKTVMAFVAAFVWFAGIATNFTEVAPSQPQSPSAQFEEASIRPCDPDNLPPAPEGARGGGPNSFQMTPGRTHAQCITLATLIRTAYGYHPYDLGFLAERNTDMRLDAVYGLGVEDGKRVRGGPDWVRSDFYSMDAVAAGAANAETMRGPMLLALLADRFRLKAHIESEDAPAFSLVIARSGLKMKPAASGSCAPRPAPARGAGLPTPIPPGLAERVRRGEKPPCGIVGQRHGPNWVYVAGEVTLDDVAQLLTSPVGRLRVSNNTGNADKFNFILEYIADGNTPRRGGPAAPPADAASIPSAPTVFAALEEQLGLRLEPAKDSREYIVIDSVQRPLPN